MKINKMNEQELDELLDLSGNFKNELEARKELSIIQSLQGEDDDDKQNDDDYKSISDEINELYNNLEDLRRKKTETIKAVIGQMYKGVLIDGKLSIRNGEIFWYKHHSNNYLSISSIKNELLANLHQIKSKITAKNLEILEFVLEFVDDENNNSRYFRVNYKLPKHYWFGFLNRNNRYQNDNRALSLQFQKVGLISFNNGRIEFFEDEKSNYSTGLTDNQERLILKRYEKEIRKAFEEHIKEKERHIENLKNEIEQIKLQAGELLIVAQLKKDNNKNLL